MDDKYYNTFQADRLHNSGADAARQRMTKRGSDRQRQRETINDQFGRAKLEKIAEREREIDARYGFFRDQGRQKNDN